MTKWPRYHLYPHPTKVVQLSFWRSPKGLISLLASQSTNLCRRPWKSWQAWAMGHNRPSKKGEVNQRRVVRYEMFTKGTGNWPTALWRSISKPFCFEGTALTFGGHSYCWEPLYLPLRWVHAHDNISMNIMLYKQDYIFVGVCAQYYVQMLCSNHASHLAVYIEK